jgi:hypothetical protein
MNMPAAIILWLIGVTFIALSYIKGPMLTIIGLQFITMGLQFYLGNNKNGQRQARSQHTKLRR